MIKMLSSLRLAVFNLSYLFVLTFVGTLAQVNMGLYEVKRIYFQSWWIKPVFPGGLLIGSLLCLNILAVLLTKMKWRWKSGGILMIHVGMVLLILGAGLTTTLSQESQMMIREGETLYYTEDPQRQELVIIDASDPDINHVKSIPESLLSSKTSYTLGSATIGISPNMNGYKVIEKDGQLFHVRMRPTRFYTPYSLTLMAFNHEKYPGTDKPKSFSSRIILDDPETGETRDVLISMNQPLRYRGKTYYQASYVPNEPTSILQVVDNPSWLLPYLSCSIIAMGMIWHFLGMKFK